MAAKKETTKPIAAPASDKKAALETALAQIEKQFGKGAVMKLGANVAMQVDAISTGSTLTKPTVTVNGKKAAQIMIISGCDDGTMNMPDFFENLRFAAALANEMQTLYPGLCRPVLFDYRKYNMDLSTGLLLIEIGSTGNTLEEAQYSAELLANAIVSLFAGE